MSRNHDVIVVGARCAGAPTAMLLARKGHRVLCVDRATFPSDTLSTHVIHPQGIAALSRWGLFERLVATGCPPIHEYAFDFGPFTITGKPGTASSPHAYCPRRTILDKLLVDAAVESGADVREAFSVDEVLVRDGRVTGIRGRGNDRVTTTLEAPLVIGADGRHSLVARAVRPERYHEKPPLLCGYYTYFRGVPMHGRYEVFIRDRRGFAAAPTHGDLTLVVGGWPYAEFEANKPNLDENFMRLFALAPDFQARIAAGERVARIVGTPVENFFHKPFGPGWALVGDAGYNKDPITAQGISDAFRDAELLANAVDDVLSDRASFDVAMARYQTTRDELVLGTYEFTTQLATMEPPPPDLARLLSAVHGNPDAMDGFCRVNAGVTSPAEFFSEANVRAIFAAAADR